MNMFRDIAMVTLIALGISLIVSNPMDWRIIASTPTFITDGLNFMVMTKPFSPVVCFALALALFMTRLKY